MFEGGFPDPSSESTEYFPRFFCGLCNSEHLTPDDARKCERLHPKVVSINRQEYRRNDKNGPPISIRVSMSNGETLTYHRF